MGKRNKNVKFKVKLDNMPNHYKAMVENVLPKKLHFTKHAIDQMSERKFKYNLKECYKFVTIENVLEVQVEKNNNVKFLVRANINSIFDIVLVVTKNGSIVTNWLNSTTDHHATLKDLHLYTTNYEMVKTYL